MCHVTLRPHHLFQGLIRIAQAAGGSLAASKSGKTAAGADHGCWPEAQWPRRFSGQHPWPVERGGTAAGAAAQALARVDEERGQLAAQPWGRVFDGEDGVWQPRVPVVLAAVGKGLQCVAPHPVEPLSLGVALLVVGRADKDARADAARGLL